MRKAIEKYNIPRSRLVILVRRSRIFSALFYSLGLGYSQTKCFAPLDPDDVSFVSSKNPTDGRDWINQVCMSYLHDRSRVSF